MQIGLIGLGKMGSLLAQRLLRAGHTVVGYDLDPEAGPALATEGLQVADSLDELRGALAAPRTIWLMLPAGAPTEAALEPLQSTLDPGDLVIDGANANHRLSLAHAARSEELGIGFLDVGVSGGIWGLDDGFGL